MTLTMKNEFGRLSQTKDNGTVVFERRFQQDIATVWDALTNPDKLAVWFMKVKMDFVPGGKMVLYMDDPANTENHGKITRIEPNKIFEWIWKTTDGPDELATWELFPDGQGTRLVFTYSQMRDKWRICRFARALSNRGVYTGTTGPGSSAYLYS